MIELSADSFHGAMAEHARVACVLHGGPFADARAAVQAIRGANADAGAWTWARIDLAEAPEIAGMFGIAGTEPHLLLMRDKVVVYCEPLAARSPEATRAVIERAGALDMGHVHRTLEQERAGRAALFARRVCPTAWRDK